MSFALNPNDTEENKQFAQALQHLIGTRYVPAVKAYIGEFTGLDHVYRSGEFHTKDLVWDRISVMTDAEDNITGFLFG